jgi:hypothetical protein
VPALGAEFAEFGVHGKFGRQRQNTDSEDKRSRFVKAFDKWHADPVFAFSEQKKLANPPVLRHVYARIA